MNMTLKLLDHFHMVWLLSYCSCCWWQTISAWELHFCMQILMICS